MDKIELRKVGDLVPHPFNLKYFLEPSADPSFLAIRESIAREGIQEPLIIKADGTILSGNLRYAGLVWSLAEKFKNAPNIKKLVNESLVPIRIHAEFASEADEVLYLIRSNLDRRQFTQERKAAIWDLWRSEYESLTKRKPGRPKADAPKVESPKDVAAKLGITVKSADALVVVKNSPLVPQSIRMRVFNEKISANIVAKAVAFAEEEAAREQRDPVQVDVLRYLENPPPKKFSDTLQETISKPTPEKPTVVKPVIEKPTEKPTVVKKAIPVEPAPIPDPEPSFEDVLVQVEEPQVSTVEVVETSPDESEIAASVPPAVETDEPSVSEPELPEYYPATDEIDESELLFDAGLDPTDPSGSGTPDPLQLPETPGFIDLHTEYPISEIKIDNNPEKLESWKEAFLRDQLAPANTPEPSNYDKAIEVLTEQAVENRVASARKIIEALLGEVILNENITGNLVGLHKSLDTFLKDIGAISNVAPAEQNPYLSGLPTDIKGQLLLSQSFVSGITEVDDPEETRDLLLNIIQDAKVSVNNLTNSKRSLEPNGLFCVDCLAPQFKTIHGDVCENGHGGAPGITDAQMQQEKAKRQAKSEPPKVTPVEDIDFDNIDLSDDPVPTSSDLKESDLDDLATSILSSHPPKGDPVVDILEEFSDVLGGLV